MKRPLLLLLALLLLPALCCAQSLDVSLLEPALVEPTVQDVKLAALYCGPTQGAYRHGELMLDPGEPYAYFGQNDCWAMVALGTPGALGAVGWVEAAMLDAPQGRELTFDDALPVMVEDDTFLTDEPDTSEPTRLFELARGEVVTLLAQYGDWGYVQTEIDGQLVRAFLPASAIL